MYLLHAGGANGVAKGEQSATSVDRQPPVQMRDAILADVATFAVLCQTDGLVHQYLCNGEAIMDLSYVDVPNADAGLLIHSGNDSFRCVHDCEVCRILIEVATIRLTLKHLDACGHVHPCLPDA